MKNLREAKIIFNEEAHTYLNPATDKFLSGITGMINKHLFPNKFDGIPKHVLKKAAERGTKIHKLLEDCDVVGDISDNIQKKWKMVKGINKIEIIHNEFLVSDMMSFATAIDKIGYWNGKKTLFDVKTTYALDEKYLSWQLSIGNWLLNSNNLVSIEKYCAIWVKDGEIHLKEIKPRSAQDVLGLMEAEKGGYDFQDPDIETRDDFEVVSMVREYFDVKRDIDALKNRESELKKQIESRYSSLGVEVWETEEFAINMRKGYTRSSIDTKKLTKDHPEIAEEYSKKTEVKPSLNIKKK